MRRLSGEGQAESRERENREAVFQNLKSRPVEGWYAYGLPMDRTSTSRLYARRRPNARTHAGTVSSRAVHESITTSKTLYSYFIVITVRGDSHYCCERYWKVTFLLRCLAG